MPTDKPKTLGLGIAVEKLTDDQLDKLLTATEGQAETDQGPDFLDRLAGGAMGAAQGGFFGGIPGAVLGGGAGAAFPPETMGDIGAQLVGGAAGGKFTSLLKKIPGLGKMLGAPLAGLAESQLMQGTKAGVDRATGEGTPDWTPNMAQAGISAMLPMATSAFSQTAAASPYSKQRTFEADMGIPPVSKVAQGSPQKAFTPLLDAKNKAIAGKEAEVANSAAQTGQMKTHYTKQQAAETFAKHKTTRRVGEIDEESLIHRGKRAWLQNMVKNSVGQMKTHYEGLLKTEVDDHMDRMVERVRLRSEFPSATGVAGTMTAKRNKLATKTALEQEKERASRLNDELTHLRESAADTTSPLHPALRNLASAKDETEYMQKLFRDTPETVEEWRKYVAGRPGGAKILADSEDAFVGNFIRDSYDWNTGLLTKAEENFKGPYNFEKIREVFGGGLKGSAMANRFQTLIRDIGSVTRPFGQGKSLAKTASLHMMYAFPSMLVFHPGSFSKASFAVPASAALLGIGWNKLADKLMRSEKLGREFHKWATEGSSAATLQALPALNRFFAEEAEPVDAPELDSGK